MGDPLTHCIRCDKRCSDSHLRKSDGLCEDCDNVITHIALVSEVDALRAALARVETLLGAGGAPCGTCGGEKTVDCADRDAQKPCPDCAGTGRAGGGE